MKDEISKTIDACLRARLPAALGEALRTLDPGLMAGAVVEAMANASTEARDVDASLRRAMAAAKELEGEIDDLASRAHDIEYSLKTASSWAGFVDDDIRRARSR